MDLGFAIVRNYEVHPHACGDNTTIVKHLFYTSTVHPPRVWGQCVACNMLNIVLGGSPPRVWGQCVETAQVLYDFRFTPTRVGTMNNQTVSTVSLPRFTPTRVGTMRRLSNCDMRICGSPPRVWGQWARMAL